MIGITLKMVLKRGKDSLEPLAIVVYIFREFFKHKCTQVAAALTYTTVLAIVPLVAISLSALSRFEASQEAFRDYIFQYLIPTPALQQIIVTNIQKFAAQTTTLSIVGGLFLVFTCAFLLNTIEGTFNTIWGVTDRRSPLSKFTVFWGVITFSPALIALALLLSLKLAKAPVVGSILGIVLAKGLFVYFLPFFLTFTSFFFIYRVLPYTKVKIPPALVGSLVATILFQVARWGFSVYISAFVKYNKIYGLLGTFPLFLLWVYICWLVILLGAEITSIAQNMKIVMKGEKFAPGQYDGYFGLRVMMTVSRSFLTGDGAVSEDELVEQLAVSHGFVSSLLNRLKQKGLLNSVDEGKETYLPARSPARISVQDVLMAVQGDFFRIPASAQRRDEKVIQQLFRQAHKGLQKGFKGISIEALVKGQGSR